MYLPTVPLPRYPDDFSWLHEPPAHALDPVSAALTFTTAPKTDFWQRTHYGFRRDDGHVFGAQVTGDFTLVACVATAPQAQYDQAGLFLRLDAENWVKCSVEYERADHGRLGSVVTRDGYSDWATRDVVAPHRPRWYRLDRRGEDLRLSWCDGPGDDGPARPPSAPTDAAWRQMRIAHLPNPPSTALAGVYGCSPQGRGARCRAWGIQLGELRW